MTTCYEPLIRAAFECLQYELGRLDRRWRRGAPVHTLRSAARSAEDFVAAMFDEVTLAPIAELDAHASMLVHDAYMRVLALASLLDEGRGAAWADPADVAWVYECATDLLEALAPCVSHADRALRQVTLEGLEIEDASRRVHAPERIVAAT